MSNISYSWPVQFVGNGESLKTVVNKYCKSNTSQKYILNRIADSPFVYDGTTIITGSLTLDYSFGYWNNHPLYTLISDNHVYTGTINMSEWKVDTIVCHATKSDLSDRAKKLSANFTSGNTALDVSSWSVITLLSIVTYKDESTALYLIRKESSSKIYCIPVKSSTQVSVTYNGENKLILTNSATYGGTYTVLFLS